eukprot:m.52202 g.52202  ORF g.52202 m.52202 type:complete len:89 (-) comp21562_c0_seq2:109-375(-)
MIFGKCILNEPSVIMVGDKPMTQNDKHRCHGHPTNNCELAFHICCFSFHIHWKNPSKRRSRSAVPETTSSRWHPGYGVVQFRNCYMYR